MATKLVRCTRVVTYLPSLRSAVIRCRTFSSQSDPLEPNSPELTDESAKTNIFSTKLTKLNPSPESSTVWPDHLLGPLGPQDKRFPLPGRVGTCFHPRRLDIEVNFKPLPPPSFDADTVLPPLPSQRHTDIAEQFLTSIDEIDIQFDDRVMGFPAAEDRLEYRAHNCPSLLRKEFKELFPNRNIMEGDLTVITISLKTENDMTLWSPQVEEEREKLLETFIQGAVELCQAFEDNGHWADFIDPSSGKPFKGPHTNFTLFETDERYRTLGFEINDLGCCKVISHPIWGTHVYIGALFTSAPLDHPLVMNLELSQ